MSTWNLGIGDVSEETRAYKDKIASKDGQIAAQQDRLVKQAEELEEMKERLNEALHKLTAESQRALQLEVDLNQRSEDLRNEKIASENAKTALITAQEKTKSSHLELRQMESTLERISNTSDDHKGRSEKLEREKTILESRVKELESNLRNVTQPNATATPGRRTISRARSSSLSNFRITTLEQDLLDVRDSLAKKECHLQTVSQKLAQASQDLMKADNEKSAIEKQLGSQINTLKALVEEKEEELEYMRQQQGEGSREDELLKRIEEDDARIAALELMLREEEGARELKERLRKMENALKEEQQRGADAQERCKELSKANQKALDQLIETRQEVQRLAGDLQEMERRERTLKDKARKSLEACEDPLMNEDSCLIDMDSMDACAAQTAPSAAESLPEQEPDLDAIAQIERLLGAIDRLRGERDALRRDVQFLETESRFAIEALEAKLSASISTNSDPHTIATIDQLRTEMDDLHAQFDAANRKNAATILQKNIQIKRLGVQVQALAVILDRVGSFGVMQSQSHSQPDVKDLEQKYAGSVRSLQDMANQRDGLLVQQRDKDINWERELEALRVAEQDAREHLEDAMHEIAELNNHIDAVESERDSLILQVTNLTSDLQLAQEELTNAESRYTNLQFHQLSNMTSNEATRTLREHIEELEGRVMRRNELVGILQHDVRRLDTNLRLQEERLMEMTSELEMMAAQKDAMVEDCADAREARNEALLRIESLEIDMENMEGKKVLLEGQIAALKEQQAVLEGAKVALEDQKAALENQKTALEGQDADNQAIINNLVSIFKESVNHVREAFLRVRDGTASSETRTEDNNLQQLQSDITRLAESPNNSDTRRNELTGISAALKQCQMEALELSTIARSLRLKTTNAVLSGDENNPVSKEPTVDVVNPETQHEDMKDKLDELKPKHSDAVSALEQRLAEAETSLEDLRARYATAVRDHQKAQQESANSIHELQEKLSAAEQQLSHTQQLHEQLQTVQSGNEHELSELKAQLLAAEQREKEAFISRDALQVEKDRLLADIDHLQQEQSALLTAQSDKLAAQQDLERKVHSLQGRFEEETRLLEISKEEAARLEHRLQKEVNARSQDHKSHASALASANEQYAQAEEIIAGLRLELSALQKELQVAQTNFASSEEEKTTLQQEITSMEAEIQKSKSLSRYLESQVKESEHLVSTLKGDIERLQSDLARSEKACKAAEVNLSLQNAQHKRETTEFQRELSALRSRPNLELALSELEERNTEMEELLRAKCTEIEENDDRVLEMLKEKKKLSAKVETLNRKVQNLQAKLAAAKASVSAPPELHIGTTPPISSRASTSAAETPQHAPAVISRPRSATVTATPSSSVRTPQEVASESRRKSLTRNTSGPSSLPRPKTPERSRAIAPVFKARTPERRIAPEADDLHSEVVIGKKRAAPDDFEACENMPAQAFTPDGEDVENKTPRVRRVLNSLQSGFTPVRHQRPTVPMPSPRRAAPARTPPTFIADLTNTPHMQPMPSSAKPSGSKRSWLGKIRGSSQDKPSSAKSIFERGEVS
ncbi:hypothetical protein JR316_0000305 [Psilocybe cubensis]|uniref:Uncharacterized protein n=2 Tax=Psilocybe cubensis TaxID=181762 RepID=A0A8H7Y982_PSICU|nr:hypothetical protein JR316_0000305 [Psilocybe cubensis]KAH9486241.1 hypothetical protein JR316_0000305 [Psilocybe cubensis]